MKAAASFAIAAILTAGTAYTEPPPSTVTAGKRESNEIVLSATFYGCTKDRHLGTFTHEMTIRPTDPRYQPTENQIENVRQAYIDTLGRTKKDFIKSTISIRNLSQMEEISPFSLSPQELKRMDDEDWEARKSLHKMLNEILINGQSGHGDTKAQRLLDDGHAYTLGIPRSDRAYSSSPSPRCETPL